MVTGTPRETAGLLPGIVSYFPMMLIKEALDEKNTRLGVTSFRQLQAVSNLRSDTEEYETKLPKPEEPDVLKVELPNDSANIFSCPFSFA